MEDWSIDKIIEHFLAETPHPLAPLQQKKYLKKSIEAKAQWMQRRASWWELKLYLCDNDFDSKLKRSCAEFHIELRKVLGCTLIGWYYVKRNYYNEL